MKYFIKQFSTCQVSEPGYFSETSISVEKLLDKLPDIESIEYDTQTLQALAFMSGYAVHQYYKRSNKCSTCLHFLTIDEEFLLDHSEESKYQYLEFVDRESLNWPSDVVLEAVVMMYKIFVVIDKDNSLMSVLTNGPSKQILVSLSIKHVENTSATLGEMFVIPATHLLGTF